ncbi:AbgT putative transporter [Halomonas sp. R57-5]|nr:AbgT putative transporter [Halomonas sp. R57-5]
MQGVLASIERVGNKLPHPFILFAILAALVVVISAILATLGVSAINPQTEAEVTVRSLLSADGVEFMLTSVVSNFVNFPPLGLILVVMFGIGLADKVGLMSTLMQVSVAKAPPLHADILRFHGRYLRQHRLRCQLPHPDPAGGDGVLLGGQAPRGRGRCCVRSSWRRV